ncbi:MAG: PAS domain S-box protein [Deltaproteobacteria bacterium]|nr:PAS domain S-box protein [Deltaproteobacteria bacterium]
MTTLIGMTVYQLLKLLIHPDISLLQSNIITVVFTTTVASTAAYFGMRKYQAQHEQLIREITVHKRLDRELRDRNEMLGIEIAERKHVEDALRAHLSFSQTLMDTVPAPIFYKDINGFYLGCNKEFEKCLGVSKEGIIGKSVYDVHPKDLGDHHHRMDLELFHQLKTQAYESVILYADGRRHDVIVHKAVFTKEDETVAGLVGVFIDITDRKRAEEEIRERELQINLLLSSTAEAICGLDINGICTFCNPACLKMLGYEAESDLIGKNLHDLFHHTHLDGTSYPMEDCPNFQTLQDGTRANIHDEVFWHKDGSSFPVEYWSYPIWRDREIVGAVITFLDITERKRAEQERQNLIKELTQALAEVKTLSGLLPICSSCKKIRDDQGYWNIIESYISRHSDAQFTHGICPDCIKKLYPELYPDLI